MALKKDGTIWGWNFNGNGMLDDNTSISRTEPVKPKQICVTLPAYKQQ